MVKPGMGRWLQRQMIKWFALLVLLAPGASGHVTEFVDHQHEPGVTYTVIGLAKDQVRILYTVPRADLATLAGSGPPEGLADFVAQHFVLMNADKACRSSVISAVDYEAIAAFQFKLDFFCDEPLDFLRLHYDLFGDEATHQNFTEIVLGQHVLQIVLGAGMPYVDVPVAHLAWERGDSWALPEVLPDFPGAKPELLDYLTAGFDHVLTGYDHLAFVFGLVLVITSLVLLAWTITAFTLAHTLTVGVSAAGIWVPPTSLIEPLIAASILYIGVENLVHLWRRRRGESAPPLSTRRRWPVAFAFGLAHGFGFSYMLRDMGLPEGEFLLSLLLFNVGVEFGQLAVVALPFLVIYLIRDRRGWYLSVAAIGSIAVSLVGGYWLFERLDFI